MWDYHKQFCFQCGLSPHHFHSLLLIRNALELQDLVKMCSEFLTGKWVRCKILCAQEKFTNAKETPLF